MKKYTAIALILAAAITLSACSTNDDNIIVENGDSQNTAENPPDNGAETGGESGTNTGGDSSTDTDTDNSGENGGELSPEEAVQAFIDQYDVDRFTAPDGTEVMLTEATSVLGDYALCFDFAYIRYAEPIYKDTVSNPEIYDFNEYAFSEEVYENLEAKHFKVVKGDVLENGMTVAEAHYAPLPYNLNEPIENEVQLEGECTIEGILFHITEDEYTVGQDDVLFYPDPTTGAVPASYDIFPTLYSRVDLESEFAFFTDGVIMRLGNINDIAVDLSRLFDGSVCVRAKVTLDSMRIQYSESFGPRVWGTLKSAEKVS